MMKNFFKMFTSEQKNALFLLCILIISIFFSNTYTNLYNNIIYYPVQLNLYYITLDFTIHDCINEFLMTLFFFSVALEIKKEILFGSLKNFKQQALPLLCAITGSIFPMIIYYLFNCHDISAIQGVAVPVATDIVLALSLFSFFSKTLPDILRVFLITLSVADDLIGILIILCFYQPNIDIRYIFVILPVLFLLLFCNIKNIVSLPLYMFNGLLLWFFCYKLGIHPTCSGILLSSFVPLETKSYNLIELKLKPYINQLIIPLFIFSNCNISVRHMNYSMMIHPIFLGVTLGLFTGKSLAIYITVVICIKLRIFSLPTNVRLKHYYFLSLFCGIGFTMSTFIALISFTDNLYYLTITKAGIITGSLLSILTILLLRCLNKKLNLFS